MKIVNLNQKHQGQWYIIPTFIVFKNYKGYRVFIVWFNWSIEL